MIPINTRSHKLRFLRKTDWPDIDGYFGIILGSVHPKLERLRRWVDDRFDNRVTRLGTLFAIITVSVGSAALLSANNLLFLIVAALLATLMISGVINRLSLAGLEMEFLLPEHLAARMPGSAQIRVHNRKSWLPSFSLFLEPRGQSGFSTALYFPFLPGGAVQEQQVPVLFPKRGKYTENNFRFSTRFPFGFAERRTSVSLKGEVIVYPNLDAKPGFADLAAALEGEASIRDQGRGTEFHSIRPYQHGEGARHLDWKGTAHTGNLQVREFAREQRRLVEIVLDTDAQKNTEWFEWAVEYSAWLAMEMTTRDWPLRFRCGQIDIAVPANGTVYDILKFLADVPINAQTPIQPDNNSNFAIVFTARMADLDAAGWHGAWFIGPDDWHGISATGSASNSRKT